MKLPKFTFNSFRYFLSLIKIAWNRDFFNKIYMGLMLFFIIFDLTHDSETQGLASLITNMLFAALLRVTHLRIVILELREKLKNFETD